MYNKIISYLNSKNLLYKHQYGFRSKCSTIHPILHMLNDCASANNLKTKSPVIAILCDLSKAFDVIQHDILLNFFDHNGIRGIAKNWIQNYLENRYQYVEINGNKSMFLKIECGVPQESILGPLLYLIYVNDIGNCTDSTVLSFAGDTTLNITDPDPTTLYQKANSEMFNLFTWFCANRLSLNPNKTKYILIKAPKHKFNINELTIKINNTHLQRVGNKYEEKSTTFLGVLIDENLNWKMHINHINNKISRAMFSIKQVKKILPKTSL